MRAEQQAKKLAVAGQPKEAMKQAEAAQVGYAAALSGEKNLAEAACLASGRPKASVWGT